MRLMSPARIQEIIQGGEWVKGAVNYDEDLHFSTFYLHASHARYTAPLYPGYHLIFAFYEGFNESYYLRKSECRETARAIIARALQEPEWLPKVVETIKHRSNALLHVFPSETGTNWPGNLSGSELLALYRRHSDAQRHLYEYARLPEALDRGEPHFSLYLKDSLRELGLPESECETTFSILSEPALPSVLAQEMIEFEQIVRDIEGRRPNLPDGAKGRARMFLSPDALRRLRSHEEKWKYLSYHGYGRRALATTGHYIERFVEHLNHPETHDRAFSHQGREPDAAIRKQSLLNSLRMDDAHRALFAVYTEIGAAKLYRRSAQLRNFYYLDLLLAEIADRLEVDEWTVRCMLPREIEASLLAGKLVDAAILDRRESCMYALLPDHEFLAAGDQAKEFHQMFRDLTRCRQEGNVLRGTVACMGRVKGPCRVIIRADDVREDIAPGTIVVSESTDPDLVGFLKNAGGVLTEQGGVTSHAALICRELGIPTIIGIEGLLQRVRDGDHVELDAQRGLVTLLDRGTKPPTGTVFSASDSPSRERIGAKAYHLNQVRTMGFTVPDYVILDYADLKKLMDEPSSGAIKRLVNWTLQELNLRGDCNLALRSSAINEDRDEGSHAGAYQSLLHVGQEQLADGLHEFVRQNDDRDEHGSYRGSILVQRMIQAEYAGVCLTSDTRTGNGDSLIIELTAGSNESITQGTVVPDRVVVDRRTGDILETVLGREQASAPVVDFAELVQQFLRLETLFGRPVDIEWALADRKLYILQARPIVMRPSACKPFALGVSDLINSPSESPAGQ
ncbi:MAG: hypothetical protein NVSMB9_00210 [Isosphaeraceae bacterium]